MAATQQTILHVVVVGFHHQLGNQVEAAYPPLPNDELPEPWTNLPFLALPDGCHTYTTDEVYFTLPSLEDPTGRVHGVACFRQVRTDELRAGGIVLDAATTRSRVQKALVVLARTPAYDALASDTRILTRAYMTPSPDAFADAALLPALYESLSRKLASAGPADVAALSSADGVTGGVLAALVTALKHSVLRVVKALILEARVVVFSSPAQLACRALVALRSILAATFDMGAYAVGPYIVLQSVDTVASAPAFAVATSNDLLTRPDVLSAALLVDLKAASCTVLGDKWSKVLSPTLDDLHFADSLVKACVTALPGAEAELEAWLASQLTGYVAAFAATAAAARKQRLDVGDDGALGVAPFGLPFARAWTRTRNYGVWADAVDAGDVGAAGDGADPTHPCAGQGSALDSISQKMDAMRVKERLAKVSATASAAFGAVGSTLASMLDDDPRAADSPVPRDLHEPPPQLSSDMAAESAAAPPAATPSAPSTAEPSPSPAPSPSSTPSSVWGFFSVVSKQIRKATSEFSAAFEPPPRSASSVSDGDVPLPSSANSSAPGDVVPPEADATITDGTHADTTHTDAEQADAAHAGPIIANAAQTSPTIADAAQAGVTIADAAIADAAIADAAIADAAIADAAHTNL
ncbi:uncharacterized protein AMSG_06777 [Thecamonas trahens ATCC 50062]|uniref:UDENN domain-containing protein n=1 Tax=Thecamonas trahens ATCC 50062 TaxID=461836 RepID=A0A0L0DDT1_THETB|nr:hypothetical protein AMSG_06777 [Thecamonas trahens ATCC 50062]KNC50296.1 hypothetical protein AMSG_06777 [Thecamonas trahens ATCC 50062]|eukprot:XP_013756843.1 hypothetical protein AMSG_06777 [Thecamonas trahens ATCC 50062]